MLLDDTCTCNIISTLSNTMGIVICNLQLASRSPSTESETGCEEEIDEAGEAFVENHITQQKLAGYLGKS